MTKQGTITVLIGIILFFVWGFDETRPDELMLIAVLAIAYGFHQIRVAAILTNHLKMIAELGKEKI